MDNHQRNRLSHKIVKEQRQRVLAANAYWCVSNVSTLNLKAFANNQNHFERRRCHSRYKTIILNYVSEPDKYRLLEDLENCCHTVDCTKFWKKCKREFSLTTASANCSEVINQMLLTDSQSLVELLNQTQTTESLTENPEPVTATLRPINDNSSEACLNQGHYNIRQESGSEEQINWFIDNDDITSLFRKYQYQEDSISKPAPLEANIQEILPLVGCIISGE